MVYIITSKTRKRAPNRDMLIMDHPDTDESRIVEPRDADRLLGNNHGWADPKPARPNQQEN